MKSGKSCARIPESSVHCPSAIRTLPNETPVKELPYERFLSHGAQSLTNAELLAVILRTGTTGCDAVRLGQKILSARGNGTDALRSLYALTLQDLLEIPGIGEVKAVKILCLAEISRRLSRERAGERPVFSSPDIIADCYMEEMRHMQKEQARLLHLDNRLALIGEDILSVGTVNCTILSPREVFCKALERGAVYIVLLHNHPSGDPTPSRQDISITRQIVQAGELMEIPLADHIIIGDLCFTSMKALGYLEYEGSKYGE